MNVTNTEMRFLEIIWEHESLSSRSLVEYCNIIFGWKKSTTYTMLRRMEEKGILQNDESVVRTLIAKEEIQKSESRNVIDGKFNGSLPSFLTAFLSSNRISDEEYEEICSIIESYRKNQK